MNASGLVDAVLTTDGDIFMFGAKSVVRVFVPSQL